MKKSIGFFFTLLALFLLVVALPAAAQDETVWVPVYSETFPPTQQTSWQIGQEQSDTTSIARAVTDKGYQWTITSPDQKYTVANVPNFTYPQGYQYQAETSVLLPYFAPYGCAGIAVQESASAFTAFLVCNDQTYCIMRNENGSWSDVSPFVSFQDFDQGKPIAVRVVINHGWADFYANDALLDTASLPQPLTAIGLFAQPTSSSPTDFIFQKLALSVSPEKAEESGLPADVPTDFAKSIRLLQKKGRIEGELGGSYQALADAALSLPQMGYFSNQMLGTSAQDFVMQADVAWKSAYTKPDYQHSGCGFTFRQQDAGTYLQVYVSMDGSVYVRAVRNGAEIPIAAYAYGNWSIEGSGTLTIAAKGAKLTVLYDQRILGTIQDATWISAGDLGFTVWSGTNLDYGTACTFTKNQLYLFQ